jgi:hypothetical protein
MKTIDKETGDKISFISFIIPEFASAYKNAEIHSKKLYSY